MASVSVFKPGMKVRHGTFGVDRDETIKLIVDYGQLTGSQKEELQKFFYMWLHDKGETRFFDLLEKYNLDAFEVSEITEPIAEQYKKSKKIAT